jgi:hypothetical protein
MPHDEDASGTTTSSAGPVAAGTNSAAIWEPDPDAADVDQMAHYTDEAPATLNTSGLSSIHVVGHEGVTACHP